MRFYPKSVTPNILIGVSVPVSAVVSTVLIVVGYACPKEKIMSEATKTIRQKVHALAEQLPADASWDDVIEEARFRRAIELGIAAADRGAFATDEEVRSTFAQWGVKV